ncbi:MAG: hypothetical protein ISP01_01900 [Methanobrevibacter arboriphilus]|uniref:Uncharacterized protein n=1 Tax=Methanobrevibacter arboriphilus TaxID=39441 RepID=A0A843A9Y8_METAZ|nr:hypothetical protein [Methanobrevibacter arboriphilus]MBF4468137.1 hypothetical protein [Methanobrevibacter arboriphilus]
MNILRGIIFFIGFLLLFYIPRLVPNPVDEYIINTLMFIFHFKNNSSNSKTKKLIINRNDSTRAILKYTPLILIPIFFILLEYVDTSSLLIFSISLLSLGLSFAVLSFNYTQFEFISKEIMYEAVTRFSLVTLMSVYMLALIVLIKIFLIPFSSIPSFELTLLEFILVYLKFLFYLFLIALMGAVFPSLLVLLYEGFKLFLSEVIVFQFQNKRVLHEKQILYRDEGLWQYYKNTYLELFNYSYRNKKYENAIEYILKVFIIELSGLKNRDCFSPKSIKIKEEIVIAIKKILNMRNFEYEMLEKSFFTYFDELKLPKTRFSNEESFEYLLRFLKEDVNLVNENISIKCNNEKSFSLWDLL